jgi:GNAT superfamily N-acetyltransferase
MVREAGIQDIVSLHEIRLLVKENVLNTPGLVTNADYEKYLTTHGKGWVFESERSVKGFAIIDTSENNIWALFVHPQYDKQGIGRVLHDTMLNWYFSNYTETLWLGTAPNTRAASFYLNAGWTSHGLKANGEVHFEMKHADWQNRAT